MTAQDRILNALHKAGYDAFTVTKGADGIMRVDTDATGWGLLRLHNVLIKANVETGHCYLRPGIKNYADCYNLPLAIGRYEWKGQWHYSEPKPVIERKTDDEPREIKRKKK